MKNKKYQTVKAVPKSNQDIVETQTTTNIHVLWLGTGTSMTSGDVKLVLWA
jgi:hypothetical protein